MQETNQQKIKSIKEKLEFLKEDHVKNNRIKHVREEYKYGIKIRVEFNPYELNPCLSEQEIVEIEKKYNLVLPEEFRAFLLHVGNGGGNYFEPLEGLVKNTLKEYKNNDFEFTKDFIIASIIEEYLISGVLLLYDYWPMQTWLILSGEHKGSVYSFYTDGDNSTEDINLINKSFLDFIIKGINHEINSLSTKPKIKKKSNKKELIDKIYEIIYCEPEEQQNINEETKQSILNNEFSTEEYMDILRSSYFSFEIKTLAGEKVLENVESKQANYDYPTLSSLYEHLGEAYYYSNNLKGIPILEKYMELKKSYYEYCKVAELYLHHNKHTEAFTAIEKAPHYYETLYVKGRIYKALGESEKAKQYLLDSIKEMRGSQDTRPYNTLAEIYLEEKDYSNAEIYYKKSLNTGHPIQDYFSPAHLGLLRIYMEQKDFENAIKILEVLEIMKVDFAEVEKEPTLSNLINSPHYKKFMNG